MSEYSNLNRGVLFKNSKKTKDSQPDYLGRIDMNGDEHFISAWIEQSKAGETYISIRVNDRTDATTKSDKTVTPKTKSKGNADAPF